MSSTIIVTCVVYLYIFIIGFAFSYVYLNYKKRQLVKANFWISVAIFTLLALLTLILIYVFVLP